MGHAKPHWLARWPKDGSHRYETTIYGDYVRLMVERRGGDVDFHVGHRRRVLMNAEFKFFESAVPLDFHL